VLVYPPASSNRPSAATVILSWRPVKEAVCRRGVAD
jgi:hypothetical protein